MAAALVAELTKLVAEQKSLNAEMKMLIAAAAPAKTAVVKKVKDAEAKTPRDATPSFMARNIYGKVLRLKNAERYASDKTEGINHLKTQAALIAEDKEAFDIFVAACIEALESTGIPASRWKKDDEEYTAWEEEYISATSSGSSKPAAKPAAAPAAAPAMPPKKVLVKKPVTAAPPPPAAAAPPKKVITKKAQLPASPVETEGMPKMTIDDEEYFFDSATNGLWEKDEDGNQGAWRGYFQPGNKEEPIRYCDAPEDE